MTQENINEVQYIEELLADPTLEGTQLQKALVELLTRKYQNQEGVFEEHTGIGGIFFQYADENKGVAEIITTEQMAILRNRGIMRNGLINSLNDEKFLSTPTIETIHGKDQTQEDVSADIEAYVAESRGGMWDTIKGWIGK